MAVSGTLATEQLPAAVSSAVYNADNQLTHWDSAAMSYDLNGNTLNDGTNSYVWDARNRLISADSNGATFSYDPLGRRASRTVMSTTTNFLYDGANPVQEQNGSGVTANLLTGGIDERFQRTDSTGTYSYLTDALGSPVALTSSTGAEQTTYSYGPYGVLSATGSNGNDYTYTGREADGLGLNYFRARYYNPQIGRFISEDPVGLAAGPNEYAYVGDSPLNFIDPSGEDKKNPFQCAANEASKVSAANGLKALGMNDFLADALGGNAFSGATDLFTSLATGQSGEGNDVHSVFYNMGQSALAGPTQGFGWPAQRIAMRFGGTLEGTPWSSSASDLATDSMVGSAFDAVTGADSSLITLSGEVSLSSAGMTATEFIPIVGEAKFAYDAATYFGAFIGCEAGAF